MALTIPQSTHQLVRPLTTFLNKHPRLIAFTALATLSTPLLYNNYRAFLDLGPGGLPYNVFGWLVALGLRPFARETRNTEEYIRDGSQERWLNDGDIKARKDERPKFGWHVAPVRQQNMLPSEEMAKRLDEIFERVVKLNPTLIEFGRSPHEKVHTGILLHSSLPTPHQVVTKSQREVGHVHPSDHSFHVTLAPLDCKAVIENGWGERHSLSGSSVIGLPKEYVGIYAPRDEEELLVAEKILVASVRFMTGRADVQH